MCPPTSYGRGTSSLPLRTLPRLKRQTNRTVFPPIKANLPFAATAPPTVLSVDPPPTKLSCVFQTTDHSPFPPKQALQWPMSCLIFFCNILTHFHHSVIPGLHSRPFAHSVIEMPFPFPFVGSNQSRAKTILPSIPLTFPKNQHCPTAIPLQTACLPNVPKLRKFLKYKKAILVLFLRDPEYFSPLQHCGPLPPHAPLSM